MQLARITQLGTDDLFIEGLDDSGAPVVAHGWFSATQNYYDTSAYDPVTGNRIPTAKPRQMTPAEVQAYALQQLQAQNVSAIVEPQTVLFSNATVATNYDEKVGLANDTNASGNAP